MHRPLPAFVQQGARHYRTTEHACVDQTIGSFRSCEASLTSLEVSLASKASCFLRKAAPSKSRGIVSRFLSRLFSNDCAVHDNPDFELIWATEILSASPA